MHWTLLPSPQDIMSALLQCMPTLQYRHETPPQLGAYNCRPLLRWSLQAVGIIHTFTVHSLPLVTIALLYTKALNDILE